MDARRDKLQGVVISLPTFCDNDYNLLLDRQRTHIGWLIEQGMVEGTAVLMGSAGLGEGYFLGDDEFERIVDVLAEEAAGRVPTMVGVFELSAREAAKKATYAARAGIDIVQLALPHYMAPSEDDVFGHFQYVNDHADIAIMAYNTPWAMPKPEFELSAGLLERFIELEHVVGVKWASHDINHYLAILAGGLGATTPQVCIAWTLTRPQVTSALTGAEKPEHVSDNFGGTQLELPADAVALLDAAADAYDKEEA